MLDDIISIVADCLNSRGIRAVKSFDMNRRLAVKEPLVCVGLRHVRIQSPGMGEYLGSVKRGDGGETEVYGLRAEVKVALDIYAPPLEDLPAPVACAGIFKRLAVLGGELPETLRTLSLCCGETAFEKASGLFHAPAELNCVAWLTAEQDDGGEDEFVDFTLKSSIAREENKDAS